MTSKSAVVTVSSAVAFLTLALTQPAGACAVDYSDAWADESYIYAWAEVYDFYDTYD
jgi:hypothetical protein